MSKPWRSHAVAALALLVASACGGPPARLAVGLSDTVVVNSRRPTQLPVRVHDASGRELDVPTEVRFHRTSGVSVSVSPGGTVTCTESGDATVRVVLGMLATEVVVLCRPVYALRSLRRLQLVLGDPAPRLLLEALGVDSLPIEPIAGSVAIADSTVATLEGLTVLPQSPGATMIKVRIGDYTAGAAVEVYERVPTLDGIGAEKHLVAVPLRLAGGEMRRWRLAAGSYLVAVLADRRAGPAPEVAFIGANCAPLRGFGEQQYHCLAGSSAAVIVYHPSRADAASRWIGHLALRRLGDLEPRDAAVLRE